MKHLTPQEMIDMPGAGKAEKHLRDTGRWDDNPDADQPREKPSKKLDDVLRNVDAAINAAEEAARYAEDAAIQLTKIIKEPK